MHIPESEDGVCILCGCEAAEGIIHEMTEQEFDELIKGNRYRIHISFLKRRPLEDCCQLIDRQIRYRAECALEHYKKRKMKNRHHQNKKNKRASLKERLIFLFTGKITNYALHANEDIQRAHLSLITNKKSLYYRNHYSELDEKELRTIMNFLATSKIKTKTKEWEEFIASFPKHQDSRRPYYL